MQGRAEDGAASARLSVLVEGVHVTSVGSPSLLVPFAAYNALTENNP